MGRAIALGGDDLQERRSLCSSFSMSVPSLSWQILGFVASNGIAKKTFHRTTTPSISSELMEPIRKRHSFLSFPYVCPEPVLAKLSFIYINGAKNGVFLPWERENAMLTPCSSGGKKSLYVQLFLVLLRLSRACLGKLFGF